MKNSDKTYNSILDRIIDDGIEAAKRDYSKNSDKLKGSIAGFEACRGKFPPQLAELLNEAHSDCTEAFRKRANDYWYWRCREVEIEWVCNVVSAILFNSGREPIIPPTARGVLKAGEILGVKESR